MKRLTTTVLLTTCCAFFISSCGKKMLESTAPDEFKPIITHTALLKTNHGDIELELYGADAPKTVKNFVGLSDKGYYDDVLFHRIVKGFVIQAGDPQTKDESLRLHWGKGGESIYGEKFEDELNPDAPSSKRGYVKGALAMANSGPNTNSSQFFIVSGKATHLPHSYTIFGYVRSGMDVVKKIEGLPLQGSTPKQPVKILSVDTEEYVSVSEK